MKIINIKYILLPVILIFLFLYHNVSIAQEQFIRLAWSPYVEPQLSHYQLYRDSKPGTMVYFTSIAKSDTIYTDTEIIEGETYYYKLTGVDVQGFESGPSNEVMAIIKAIPGEDNENVALLEKFELEQNYPNPFNPKTTIKYSVSEYTNVSIIIYNILGKKIKKLVNEYREAGTYNIEWDGKDDNGRPVSTGVYFYQMSTVNFQAVKKLMLQK